MKAESRVQAATQSVQELATKARKTVTTVADKAPKSVDDAQKQLEVGRAEGPLARLVVDGLAGERRQLGDQLRSGLTVDQHTAHGALVADAQGRAATQALGGRAIRQVGAVGLACMQHGPPALAPRLQQPAQAVMPRPFAAQVAGHR